MTRMCVYIVNDFHCGFPGRKQCCHLVVGGVRGLIQHSSIVQRKIEIQ